MALMIRSPRDLNAQKKLREQILELIASQSKKLATEGKRDDQIARRLEPLRLRLAEVDDTIELYTRLKQGDTTVLKGMDFGVRLIGLRIAAGLTQRELARLLSTTAGQVARDEVNEYRTISRLRLERVAHALGRNLDLSPLGAEVENSARRSGRSNADRRNRAAAPQTSGRTI
jgi:transcriptional regulator with XRE-family HTH domain